tara:strand:+ start:1616 stop:2203 length:588 start_codon:yes stop_codon:yes gene_type:complete
MTANKKIIQAVLLLAGIILILGTYFLYPELKQKKANVIEPKKEEVIDKDKEVNVFENVEYKGIYNLNNSYTIKSNNAKIFTADPDVVHMKNMHVTIFLNDGRIIKITSDKGKYNKVTYDSFFEKNVRATDGDTVILAENLDLLATEKWAMVYNDVIVEHNEKSSLKADKIHYDFTSELYQVSMFNNKKVKIKLVE